MPRIEIEIDDQGVIVGETPESLAAIFKRIETTAHGAGYGTGAQKAAEEAKKQIADAVALEKRRMEANLPYEKEKLTRLEEDYKALQTRQLESAREHDTTLKGREEAHARALIEREESLKKRNEKIVGLTKAQLRSDAARYGARDESLDELEVILHASIGYGDDMEPFVRNPDGSPRTSQGKATPVSAFVKEYLDSHTHHRKPATGAGGGARGGASFQGHTGANVSLEQAKNRVESGDRSASAIDDLFQASRKKSA